MGAQARGGMHGRASRGGCRNNSKRLWPELPAPGFGCLLCCISAGVSPKTLSWRGAQLDDLLEANFNFFFLNTLNSPKGVCYLLGFAYLRGSVSLTVTSRGKIIGFTR